MQRSFVVLAALLLAGCDSDQNSVTDRVDAWLIENVSVVDVRSGTATSGQSVLIKGNKIVSIGTQTDAPKADSVERIDGSGKFLIPGLWDMHIHTSDVGETRNSFLPLLIANGVTGARSMAADCHFEGGDCGEPIPEFSVFAAWREEIASGQLVGPRLVGSSYYTNGPASMDKSSIENPATAEHGRAYARLLKSRGVDLIKVYGGMYREAYFAMAEEARSLALEFGGEIPLTVRASEASNAGHSTIEHVTGFLEECSSEEEVLRPKLISSYSAPAQFWFVLVELAETFNVQKCQGLYERLAENDTWLVATLYLDGFYDGSDFRRGKWRDDPNLKYVPRSEVELWQNLEEAYFGEIPDYKNVLQPFYEKKFQMTGEAHEAGVPVMAGSDAGEIGVVWGFSLHAELQYLVEAGLSEATALRAATLNPARYRGLEDQLGTIEKGKLADLVLLSANPLDDISNTQLIDTVITNGRVFRRCDLDALLENVEAYAKSTWKEPGSIAK